MKVFTLIKPFYYKLVALLCFILTSFFAYSQYNKIDTKDSGIESDLSQSANDYTLTIVLPLNFWESEWFKIPILIVLIGAILLILRFYKKAQLSRQRIKFEKALAIKQERMRISTDMHDEIGSGLTTIRLLSEIASKKCNENEMIHDVKKIAAYSTDLSLKMREVIWSLNAESDTLNDLLSFLRRYVTDLFEAANFDIYIDFPAYDENINIEISGQDRRDIFLAVKEALNNTIKHARANKIIVKAQVKDDLLEITIKDNGNGLEQVALQSHCGNGLRNMQTHMDNVNGQLRIHSENGTSITFIIPLEQHLIKVWEL